MVDNRRVVFPDAETVHVEEIEQPEPGPEEVLIETRSSLISTGTELTILSGDFPEKSNWSDYGTYPFVAGYANVGEVIATGSEADIEVGTLVANRGPHQQFVTAAADAVTPVPESISTGEAAFFVLAAITMNGVRRGRVEFGDAVAVFGLGLLGQLTARWCQLAGARPVVGFDLSPERLAFLPDDVGIVSGNPNVDDAADIVREHNRGRPADVVLEVTGVPAAIPDQFDVLRRQGRFVVLSSPRGETSLDLHDYCNAPGYEIIGAHEQTHPPTSTPNDPWSADRHRDLFFDLLERGEIDVSSLITRRVSPEDAPDVYHDLLDDRTQDLGVVFQWD